MKKISFILSCALAVSLLSCESAESEAAKKANSFIDKTISDGTKMVDTTLSSIGDSLKADFDSTKNKFKESAKSITNAAKDKLVEGTQKVKDAAEAGIDAAKEKLKN